MPPLYAKGHTLGFLDEVTRQTLGRAVVEGVTRDGLMFVVRLRKDGAFELPLESLCGNFARQTERVAIRNNRFENVGYARDPQTGRPIGREYRGEISVVGTYDDVTVEGSTWGDMDNDHELVWFEKSGK